MKDEAYLALADSRRRALLGRLLDGACVDIASLVAESDGNERRIRVELHHIHLPMLDGMGFVTWHRDDERVERGQSFDTVRPLIESDVVTADPEPSQGESTVD